MTERMIENRLKKLEQLEEQKKALEAEIESLKEEIKNEMQESELLETKGYIIRFTNVLSERFDSKRFKAEFTELYSRYTKPVASRRFSFVAR